MENNMMYVVLNGDGTGKTLGTAISNNDIDALQSSQGGINDAHSQIEQWVQENGGQVISSSGDESIFTISRDHAVHLDKLLSFYQNASQHSATIGVGNTISEAVKAIVYGKNNGRGAINEYSPEMESSSEEQELPEQGVEGEQGSMEQEDQAPEMEQEDQAPEVPEHEQNMSPEEKDIHDSTEDMTDEEEIEQENQANKMDAMEDSQGSQEDSQPSEEQEDNQDLSEQDMEGDDQEAPMEGDDQDQDDDSSLKNVLQSHLAEDDNDQMEGDDQEAPMEGDDQEMPMEGDGDQSDEMSEEMPMEGDDGQSEESIDENPENQMEGEEGEGEFSEEGEDDSQNPDQMIDLKNEIGNALEQFQMNKEVLEGHKDSNPELYSAMLTMVGAMIHMSKMLGLDSTPDDQSDSGMVDSNPILEEDTQDFPQGK